jgi:hypothetical protein
MRYAWFQASAAKWLRTAFFWVIRQRVNCSLPNNPEERIFTSNVLSGAHKLGRSCDRIVKISLLMGYAWFQASAAKWLRTAFFWVIRQRDNCSLPNNPEERIFTSKVLSGAHKRGRSCDKFVKISQYPNTIRWHPSCSISFTNIKLSNMSSPFIL